MIEKMTIIMPPDHGRQVWVYSFGIIKCLKWIIKKNLRIYVFTIQIKRSSRGLDLRVLNFKENLGVVTFNGYVRNCRLIAKFTQNYKAKHKFTYSGT